MSRMVVDPITRIEGHLRIEAQVDGGKITDAWSSVTMWRGLEKILQGRDPRDAWYFTQRICGVCTSSHALASVRAVEDALDITPPPNAAIIRDLMYTSQATHDHVIHFYHLHALDWVDVVSALKADPREAAALGQSLSGYANNTVQRMTAVKEKLQAFVAGGRLGPFTNGYWGHPAMKLPPAVNLLAVAHYLDALDWQREYIKIHAILGGKNPHPQSYLVGGVAVPIDPNSMNALNADSFIRLRRLIQMGIDFVRDVYIPDLLAIASFYPEWTAIGGGINNYMSAGDLFNEARPTLEQRKSAKLPSGIVKGLDLTKVYDFDPNMVAEDVTHSWYALSTDEPLHPFDGETNPDYSGPKPPFEYLDVEQKYSWLKSPRYEKEPMEVGPLARMIVGYARGDAQIKKLVNDSLAALKVGPAALHSTLGRTLARGLESEITSTYAMDRLDSLIANVAAGDLRIHAGDTWDPKTWPAEAKGAGFEEAPRGMLSHWIKIKDGVIDNYQAVVPSTWNGSPRDRDGIRGAYEASLVGTPVAVEDQPLEILRTIHSFDPCMACAAHVMDADGNEVVEVKVL